MAIGQKVDFLFRKIDGCFDVDTQTDQLFGQVMHTLRECALQRTQSIARSLCRTGFDKVGNGFGLGQIELVIQKCALAELARACLAASQLNTALQQHIENDGPAVTLQFQYVFAGKRVRAREVQGDAFIEHLTVFPVKRAVVGVARLQFALAECFGCEACERAGDTHDPHTTSALGCCHSGNGFSRNTHKTGLKTKVMDSKTPH